MPLRALQLLGRTIRRLRKQRGLSQMKLAELSGVHLNEISNVERGERDARATSLLKIARRSTSYRCTGPRGAANDMSSGPARSCASMTAAFS